MLISENEGQFQVSGKWLDACGLGTEDRTFDVRKIELIRGRQFVTVDVPGYRPDWVVAEWNGKLVQD